MTGDTMKSDCAMDSRCRSEGRPSLPRRRVATKTSHENGDFEMELSLAIKESLKYVKEKEGHQKALDKASPHINGVKSDESFSRMAGKMLSFARPTTSDQGPSSEVQPLKELLLFHIELIQHQQEQLSNKDKEIRILRNEKDKLQCRLQKVEKRLVHLKQKEDILEAEIANARSTAHAREATPASEQGEKARLAVKAEQPAGRKRRQQPRKVQPKKQKQTKKHAVDAGRSSESVTSEEADAEQSESGDEDEVDGEDMDEDEISDVEMEEKEETEKEKKGVEDRTDENKNKVKEEMEEEEEEADPHPQPVLRTDCLYHVSCCVEVPEDDPMEVNDEKEVVTGEEVAVTVETPGWRINVLTNRYQLEGTENITDEAYQKRHQKHEVEERRRKRWDIQHMREQKVLEKLRGKEESGLEQTEQSLKTFLPSIDDLTHIEGSENVPVVVFGRAVPLVQPSEFELPWDTGPASSYTRKSHGGRGRQK